MKMKTIFSKAAVWPMVRNKHTKSKRLILTAGILVLFSIVFFAQQEHREIVEEVSVRWWLVPVFALDSAGSAVSDLKAEDIEVWLNNRRVTNFEFYKRTFGVDREEGGVPSAAPAEILPPAGQKVVVLLFDLTNSNGASRRESRQIAEKIIREAENSTRFIVLTIESFAGLKLIGEGSGDKEKIIHMLRSGVRIKHNPNNGAESVIMSAMRATGGEDSAEAGIFYQERVGSFLRRRSMSFFHSIETLYIYLNSLEANKFIYLFSEGISRYIMGTVKGGNSFYYAYLKKAARQLSRSGAMLFIINAAGTITRPSGRTGENSLNFLAEESGGAYLDGYEETIVQKLKHFNRAYYEISFPDFPGLKGSTRTVTIESRRGGINIHTLRSLEKSKNYTGMSDLEKELLALNLVTQNPLLKDIITMYNARLEGTRAEGKKVVYTVVLPSSFVNKSIDLYKIWVAGEKDENGVLVMKEVVKIEKVVMIPREGRLEIPFNRVKQGENREIGTYFVLIDGSANSVRLHGIREIEPDPEFYGNVR